MGDRLRDGDPDTSGPKIVRPIPRRPFNLAFASPTPPEEDEDHSSPRPQISASDLRFLAPHQHAATPGSGSRDGSTPLSHTTSYLNLTAGALFGIYSPSTLGSFTKDEDDQDQDQYFADRDRNGGGTDTPIDSPAPRPGLDDETYELMRSRSSYQPPRRGSLLSPAVTTTAAAPPSSRAPKKRHVVLQLMLRAALLFVLGVGYGVLVTRLPQNSHHHQHASHRLAAAYESHYEWRYLAFWGAAGVALGSLLPWFDRFWESKTTLGSSGGGGGGSKASPPLPDEEEAAIEAPLIEKPTAASPPQADWVLVVRGIGAFVGIVFAIRKLPWASTMQVSLTLALANPFLWYLIDRSKPGFLLSAAVGLAGSAVLMGLNPDVMPAPAAAGSSTAAGAGAALYGWGRGVGFGGNATASGGGSGGSGGGLASQETIETSIWMLSVLFCSCVCFGNIGRRLTLNSSAAGRGRWGGVR